MELYLIRNSLIKGKSIYDLPLRVTFYARVSTDHEEQLNSLENQIMYFEKFIKEQQNWTFIDGYIDEGITGTSVKKRQEFLRMIDDACRNKFDLILTKEISRFSRNTLDSIKYTQELLKNGVGVHFLNDNINTFQPDSELRLTIMSSIAQEEIRKLSERIRFGYQRSVEKGVVSGSNNIYGYIKDKGKLSIDKEQAKLVKLIFQIYVSQNIGVHKLGIKLFKEYGISNYSGRPLAGSVITNIIRNPKYKGYFCAHKETTIDYLNKKRKKFNEKEWILYKDNKSCPPIVSEYLWKLANDKLDERSKKHKRINNNNRYSKLAFSGLMHCYLDGATFVRGAYRTGKGENQRKRKFWACNNYRIHGKKKTEGCNSSIVYYEEVVVICKRILDKIFFKDDSLIRDLFEMINSLQVNKNFKKEISLLEDKLLKLNKEKKELTLMRMQKEVDNQEYKFFKEERDLEIKKIEDDILKLKNQEEQQSSDKNYKKFKKNVISLIFSDEEKILDLVETLFQEILVETVKEEGKKNKVILHIKTNIFDKEDRNIDLEKFLLLFCSS